MTPAQLAGSLLCVGFPGDSPENAPLEELRELAPGAVILFSRNVSTPERTRELVDAIRGTVSGVVVAIDQEGGRVARLRRGVLAFPSAMAVAASGNAADAELLALGLAGDLRRAGVDLNLAPVADLALSPPSTVIGTRAYSDDPLRAAEFVAATVRGLQRGGVAATLKHFPGHGATATDSHEALPELDVAETTLRKREFVPFEAGIAAGARAVMMGHLLVRALDSDFPASLSRRVVGEFLRGELGFDGVVVTDCLQMDAIASGIGTIRAAVTALAAGADLITISHDLAVAGATRDAIVAAVDAAELSRASLEKAALRVGGLRSESAAPAEEFNAQATVRRIVRSAITSVRGEPVLSRSWPVNVVSFEGSFGDGVTGEDQSAAPLHLALRRRRFQAESLRVSLDPSGEMLENLLTLVGAQRDRTLVILMRRAHLHERQAQAIDALLELSPEAVLVSALEPFDVSRFVRARNVVCSYGDDEATIEALADVLARIIPATGSLPVALEHVAS